MTVVLGILALGMLIVVHEGGHYFVARWCGMRVDRFSIGFGPAILKWRRKGTQFQIAPIPFGGFVQIVGMNPHEEYDQEDPMVYPNRPTILRFLTIFAGPFTNILFASVLIFVVFVGAGQERPTGNSSQILSVKAGAPAAKVLKEGDVITAIDGLPASSAQFRERVMASDGRPVEITFVRDGKTQKASITPQKDGDAYRVGLGLADQTVREKIGVASAAYESIKYTVVKSKQILTGLWGVVQRPRDAEFIGPIGMTDLITTQIRSGWITALEFLAMLNVYLGLFNLLPLPALDGGRLAFLTYELATRRRPNPKVETAVHMAGMLVLLLVLFLVSYKEIGKLIG